jgi:hypothetical protein
MILQIAPATLGTSGGATPKEQASMHIDPTWTCTGCGETKPLTEYHVDRARKNGRCTRCKACHTARHKARWADPEKRAELSEANSKWHRENAERNTERTAQWWANRGGEYKAERKAAGCPVAGTTQYHAERLNVLERDDGLCGICGEDIDPLDYDLDHIIPTSKGGLHEMDNLQLAHRACNSRKAANLEMAA